MLDVDHQTLRVDLFPFVDFVQGSDLASRDAGVVEFGEQRLGLEIGEHPLHFFDDFLAVAHAVRIGGELRPRGVDPERRGKRFPELFASHADLHPALPAVEQSVGGNGRVLVALGLRHFARNRGPGALEGMDPDQGREQ
ncbi:hypothetical protein NicSoilC12_31150 [Arthrobacter sp. NicSoilC12]|nr:hypothetical protein NicSoilC12_31150 [Arthrobacter sp. NicSoilC12]